LERQGWRAANDGATWSLATAPQLSFEFVTLSYAMGAGSKTTNSSEVKDEHQVLTLVETKAIEVWLLENKPKAEDAKP
jgi:hypothetical protein